MRVKQNPLIRAALVLMILIPVSVALYNKSNDTPAKNDVTVKNNNKSKPLTTKSEDIAALSGYVSQVESSLKDQQAKLDTAISKSDVEKIVKDAVKEISVDARGSNLDEDALMQKLSTLIDKKTTALKQGILTNSGVSPNEVGSVDEALQGGEDLPFADTFEVNGLVRNTSKNQPHASGGASNPQWGYPVGYVLNDKKNSADGVMGVLTGFGQSSGQFATKTADNSKALAKDAKEALEKKLQPIPFATIHSDSSIHGATALTALIGRVERDGATHDPYKFQVMLSGETLMANGQSMPGVANAIISGEASGDLAFGCVRGRVTSMTFNFSDGRIYNQRGTFEKPLAHIGDQWGNPCVTGIEVSNIKTFLIAQGAVSGLASASESIAKQQQTVTSSNSGITTSMTGDMGKLALGSFGSGSLTATGDVIKDLYKNYYQAIYVPPGQKVSILFDEDITIDYKPTNRKVSYEKRVNRTASLD